MARPPAEATFAARSGRPRAPADRPAGEGGIAHGPRDRAAIALTFDDGPGAVTAAVLDALADHGAHATFDVLGPRVAPGRALLRRTAAEGHEIGVHGWEHRALAAAPGRACSELARACAAITAACGVHPRVFRAPFGIVSPALVAAAAALGLVTVGWDVDPHDWREPGAAAIERRVLAGVRPGSIVLLHDDRAALAPTAEALEGILPALAARALRAVTVSELLGR